MIRRPASCLGSNPVKSQLRQIEFINEDVNHLNGIVLINPVFQTLGNSVLCPRSVPSTKRFIQSPAAMPESPLRESHEAERFYTGSVIRDRAISCQC